MSLGSVSPQAPLLHIYAGSGLSLTVTNPDLQIYIGSRPPDPLADMAVIRFDDPQPIGARLIFDRKKEWSVLAAPGPITVIRAHDRMQLGRSPADELHDADEGDKPRHFPISLLTLEAGVSRLILGQEEISLLVPVATELLSAGDSVSFVSKHQRALELEREKSSRQAREKEAQIAEREREQANVLAWAEYVRWYGEAASDEAIDHCNAHALSNLPTELSDMAMECRLHDLQVLQGKERRDQIERVEMVIHPETGKIAAIGKRAQTDFWPSPFVKAILEYNLSQDRILSVQPHPGVDLSQTARRALDRLASLWSGSSK
jgi:hypothetical protein